MLTRYAASALLSRLRINQQVENIAQRNFHMLAENIHIFRLS